MITQNDFKKEILTNVITFEPLQESRELPEQENENSQWVPFPVEVLPEAIQSFVDEAAISVGCDPILVVNPLLAACAGAIGNTRVVALKSDFMQPSILWTVSIASSGEKKTPPFELVRKLFDKHEQEAEKAYRDEKKRYDLACKSSSRKRGDKTEDNARQRELICPTQKRFVLNDTTVEAAALRLSQNPRGLTIMCDEFSGWYEGHNSYKKGNGDEAFYLQAFQGASHYVDRKNGESSLHVPRCSLSITGGTQPKVFQDFLRQRRNVHNGMAARFLIAMPPSRVSLWSESCISEKTFWQMQAVFDGLLAMEFQIDKNGNSIPQTVSLSEKAKSLFVETADAFAEGMQGLSEALRSLWSKMAGRIARIALVFHCIRLADGDKIIKYVIDEQTMQSAIEVGRWYANEAKRCYSFFGIGNDETSLPGMEEDILKLVAGSGEAGMTRRELQRRRPTYFSNRPKIMDELVREGKLRSEQKKPDGPGAPTTVYFLPRDDTLTELTE